MHKFKDFNLPPRLTSFKGEKIKIQKLFNVPIKVMDFKIEPSKKKPGTDMLTVQIEMNGEERIFFSGSKVLMDQIGRVPKDGFPFETTVVGDRDYFEFT